MSNFKIVCRTVNDHRFGVDLIDPANASRSATSQTNETRPHVASAK
jgi:hypothetical protein